MSKWIWPIISTKCDIMSNVFDNKLQNSQKHFPYLKTCGLWKRKVSNIVVSFVNKKVCISIHHACKSFIFTPWLGQSFIVIFVFGIEIFCLIINAQNNV